MWKIVANHLGGKYFEVGVAKSLEEAKKQRELLRDTYGDEWDFVYYRID